eukprot:2653757-Amphidinium_carterae.1
MVPLLHVPLGMMDYPLMLFTAVLLLQHAVARIAGGMLCVCYSGAVTTRVLKIRSVPLFHSQLHGVGEGLEVKGKCELSARRTGCCSRLGSAVNSGTS